MAWFSVVVAVLAGIVGVVSLTEARASWSEARGAAFQLLLNVTVLIAMGALVLRLQRIIWTAREPHARRASRES